MKALGVFLHEAAALGFTLVTNNIQHFGRAPTSARRTGLNAERTQGRSGRCSRASTRAVSAGGLPEPNLLTSTAAAKASGTHHSAG